MSDTAELGFFIRTSGSLANSLVSGTWSTITAPAVEGHSLGIDGFLAGPLGVRKVVPWPGTAFSPSGVATDYPGWRPLEASDFAPNGYYINPANGEEVAPEIATDRETGFVFNGLILDPSEIDFAWRGETKLVLEVNPTLEFLVTYPDASAGCFQARDSNVVIEKTASVAHTDPGKSFTYSLAVHNLDPEGAADGVLVTDKIPADLKITDVTWPGKGDAGIIPNWTTCAVTGQDAAGYGGTLTCDLLGPLYGAGSPNGPSSAPTIALSATVNPASKATVITNIGAVDYHTAGFPEDVGHDEDDAVVTLSALPVTGGVPMWTFAALGLLALIAGTLTLVVLRRRRGEPEARL